MDTMLIGMPEQVDAEQVDAEQADAEQADAEQADSPPNRHGNAAVPDPVADILKQADAYVVSVHGKIDARALAETVTDIRRGMEHAEVGKTARDNVGQVSERFYSAVRCLDSSTFAVYVDGVKSVLKAVTGSKSKTLPPVAKNVETALMKYHRLPDADSRKAQLNPVNFAKFTSERLEGGGTVEGFRAAIDRVLSSDADKLLTAFAKAIRAIDDKDKAAELVRTAFAATRMPVPADLARYAEPKQDVAA